MKTRLSRMFVVVALLCAAFSLSACGPDLSSPDATLKTFAAAFQAKDKEKMAECYLPAEREKMTKGMDKDTEKSNTEAKKWTATSKGSKKEGNWTLGTIEIKSEGEEKGIELTVVLVEEDGKWYLSEDKLEEYHKEKFAKMFGNSGG